jgi:hypothetical protein
MKEREKLSRARFVQTAIILPAFAAALTSLPAEAQAPKGSKTQFKYQDTPKNGQQCSGCTFFIAGKTSTASGTCKIVQGDISPKGWCQAWSKKS